ncbi:hypothetical protein IMSAGC011_02391 [Lachnospiraceae bacterium]|nr:hypothetical protein IMSAGC011_02391 [Lachnospiraceae bacterium]
MNQSHIINNPWATSKLTVQCDFCNKRFVTQCINCFDMLLWPDGRQILNENDFFHPVCPHCHNSTEIIYPCRYIDRELGIAAVLIPDIENQNVDEMFSSLNNYADLFALNGVQHRAVGNFYALAEQMHIHKYKLNDKAIQLMKPFIIGNLQANGFEVWNGFFIERIHPEKAEQMDNTIYISTQEDQSIAYSEDIYQFYIYLTNGDIILHGINDTAYQICMNILTDKGLLEDDGRFHLYDLSWSINFHNSLHES